MLYNEGFWIDCGKYMFMITRHAWVNIQDLNYALPKRCKTDTDMAICPFCTTPYILMSGITVVSDTYNYVLITNYYTFLAYIVFW